MILKEQVQQYINKEIDIYTTSGFNLPGVKIVEVYFDHIVFEFNDEGRVFKFNKSNGIIPLDKIVCIGFNRDNSQ